jgi:CHAT domain
LLLKDWKAKPLTAGDLLDHRLQENPPFLGYLSACSTGAIGADRHVAGFRHVIGTLWEVSDAHCVDIARIVYGTIRDNGMTDRAIYQGIHRAVGALRDGQIKMISARDHSSVSETADLQMRLLSASFAGNNPRNMYPNMFSPCAFHFTIRDSLQFGFLCLAEVPVECLRLKDH